MMKNEDAQDDEKSDMITGARDRNVPEPWGGVPPYCTGHTPTPPRRLIAGAPFALRKVSPSQVVNVLDLNETHVF